MWLDNHRTALYRLYDADGTLLYIGISHDPNARFEQHAKLKDWWPLVAQREVEWFDDRPTAATAEAEAIRSEDPEHNGTYSLRRDRRTARDVVAHDGLREVSLSLARPKIAGLLRSVENGGEPIVLLSHGRRDAVIVSVEFYEQALAARGLVRQLIGDS
ncbi:type II toxin-antitoxin system prevent-host-death family antitoxin [Streptomyces echinatus]|uniref:type II toxin-antitoxin system prevent-host-death family antitoxin n=1 Tax=Streptomyces echinatus TaxID=67293 RepID=UPI0037A1A2C6